HVHQAAAADLQVVARGGPIDALAPDLALHPGAQVVHVLGRRRAALVGGRVRARDHPRPEVRVPRARARLHQRLPLPALGVLPLVGVPGWEGGEAAGRRAGPPWVAGGTGAGVELAPGAVVGRGPAGGQPARRGARVALRRVLGAPAPGAVVVVDEDEVQIRAV